MSKKKRIPSMLKHSTGQAQVILSGKVFYLGVWGTSEAHAKYAELVRRWEENGRQPLVKVSAAVEASYSISDLFKHYLEYLDETGRYTKIQ